MPEQLQPAAIQLKEIHFGEPHPEGNPQYALPDVFDHVAPDLLAKNPTSRYRAVPTTQYKLDTDSIRQLEQGTFEKKGATSYVLRGKNKTMNKNVVYKVLQPQFSGNPRNSEYIHREARLLAQLPHHPNLPRVDTILVLSVNGKDLPVMVMEELESIPWDLNFEEVLTMADQIAEALDVLHGLGISHLDVKPNNIMKRKNGEYVLVDFGYSYNKATNTMESNRSDYSDQVQLENSAAKSINGGVMQNLEQADQFSLAATLFRLLTGKYVNNTELVIFPDHPDGDYPLELYKVFQKAMHVQRAVRYDTCKEFVDAFKKALRDVQNLQSHSTLLSLNQIVKLAKVKDTSQLVHSSPTPPHAHDLTRPGNVLELHNSVN